MARVALAVLVAIAVGCTAIAAVLLWPARSVEAPPAVGSPALGAAREPAGAVFAARDRTGGARVRVAAGFERPPRAGLLFDVDTGEVLWSRAAGRPLPIASLTKLMTARLVSRRHSPDERVLISRRAARVGGSKLGVLPEGRRVPLEPLLYGLIMASANDAAIALAEHDAGSVGGFVARMNAEARLMGLGCTRFSTPSGLRDQGNRSCALDLAELARADLADPRIARIARTRGATFPFPIRSRALGLYNNHLFLQRGIRGLPRARVTGLKTGYTDAAGRCYLTTARIGDLHLGVVLLDSPAPFAQVPALLRAGFAAVQASRG